MNSAGRMEIIRELCSFEGRLAGTDAERRAANRLAERLREIGRRAEIEPIHVHPQVGLVYALHCLVGFAGSLAAVAVAPLGFALALCAATSMYLDLNARHYLLRRLFFRRASQNLVSRGARPDAPARLLIVAHVDAARTGAVFSPGRMRLLARLDRRLPFALSPTRILFWSLAVLVPVLGVRMAGVDSNLISLLQLPPTLVLLIGVFACVEIALSPVAPGANDDASGVATALSLAERLAAEPPDNLDPWVVLTGGGECPMQGMRAFTRDRRRALDRASTYVLNIDSVGRGDVRFEVGEGPAVTFELHSRLTELCAAIAEADRDDANRFSAEPLSHGFGTDALPARLLGLQSTTITCLERGAIAPANYRAMTDTPEAIDPDAVARAHDFALELIRRLDADVGRAGGVPPRPKQATKRRRVGAAR